MRIRREIKNIKNYKLSLDIFIILKVTLNQRGIRRIEIMNENVKSYMIKDIPVKEWREFKIKLLQNGFNTYNEALLYLIKKYADNELVGLKYKGD